MAEIDSEIDRTPDVEVDQAGGGGAGILDGLVTLYTVILASAALLSSGGEEGVKVAIDGDSPFTVTSATFALADAAGQTVDAFGAARVDSADRAETHAAECRLNKDGLAGTFILKIALALDDGSGYVQVATLPPSQRYLLIA